MRRMEGLQALILSMERGIVELVCILKGPQRYTLLSRPIKRFNVKGWGITNNNCYWNVIGRIKRELELKFKAQGCSPAQHEKNLSTWIVKNNWDWIIFAKTPLRLLLLFLASNKSAYCMKYMIIVLGMLGTPLVSKQQLCQKKSHGFA